MCHDVFLMDFGDATFTSFEGNTDWIKFFQQFPEIDPTKRKPDSKFFIGKLHSHHSMGAFHSPTDTQDLYENAPKLPFFLSLVVNYACDPFAEIAIAGQVEKKQVTKTKWKLSNWNIKGMTPTVEKKKEPLTYVIPCTVLYQEAPWFIAQLKAIQTRPATPTYYNSWSNNHNPNGNSYDASKSTKEEKPLLTKSAEPYYTSMTNMQDLISLGNYDGNASLPYKALSEVNSQVQHNNHENYIKAIKQYFNEWYQYYFAKTAWSETEVLTALNEYTEQHKYYAVTKHLKKAFNELKEEYRELREV